jgi:uncharacterized protein (TIGR02466 family)
MVSMIESIFATPLYKSDNCYKFSDKELTFLKSLEMMDNRGNEVTKDKHIFDHDEMSQLKKWCEKNLNYFMENLGKMKGAEFYITQSWFNKTVPLKHHHSHMHPNSIISAVLYVEGPNCPTFFYNRDSFNNFTFFEKINGNPFTSNKVGVLNEPGRLVLFPSYLHHEVDINKGNSDRYSISFNTFVKGKFGDNENLTELDI